MATAATGGFDATRAVVVEPIDGGVWVPMTTAAELLGVSVRTLQRRAAAGAILTRSSADGRREAFVTRQRRGDATDVDAANPTELKRGRAGDNATNGRDVDATPAAALVLADLATRRADELAGELRRARRATWGGWAAAAVVGVLAGVGAFWAAWSIGDARAGAAAADATAAIVAKQAESERRRADRAELERARAIELAGDILANPTAPWPNPPILSQSLDGH